MSEEKDIQILADEHGKSFAESCREQLDILETAEDGQERLEELREQHNALVLAFESADGDAAHRKADALSDFDNSEDGRELQKLEALSLLENWGDEDGARSAIDERPLSVEVRSGWYAPGNQKDATPEEYCILLGTGGPASRVIGELSEYGEAQTAGYEYQDWFQPWTAARLTVEEEETLLKWAQQFYFGS